MPLPRSAMRPATYEASPSGQEPRGVTMGDRWLLLSRAVLAYGFAFNAMIGVWGTVSPRGWYDDFPGFGKVWVAIDGPFNEHLVRDVAAWSLALAVLCAAAFWTAERRIMITAGLAMAVQSALHAQYHLSADNPFDTTGEQVESVSGIVLLTLLGLGLAFAAWRSPPRGTEVS